MGKYHDFYVQISLCSWSFKTDDKDIGFGVHHKSVDGDKEKEVLPVTRVDSHLMEQDGSLVCEQAGKCKCVILRRFEFYLVPV